MVVVHQLLVVGLLVIHLGCSLSLATMIWKWLYLLRGMHYFVELARIVERFDGLLRAIWG